MAYSIRGLLLSSESKNDSPNASIERPYIYWDSEKCSCLTNSLMSKLCQYDIIVTDILFEEISSYISLNKEARCRFIVSEENCFAFEQYINPNDTKKLLDLFKSKSFDYDADKNFLENAVEFIDQCPFLDAVPFDEQINSFKHLIKNKSLLIAIGLTSEEIKNYSFVLEPNIVGYFDFQRQVCVDFTGELLPSDFFENVIFVNTLNRSANIDRFLKIFKGKNIFAYGDFCENNNLYGDDYWEPLEVDSNTPIILITSSGPDLEKFWLQTKLFEQFNTLGIKHSQISYSPLAAVSNDFIYQEFPKKVIFPDYINEIRGLIDEIDSTQENEAIMINVGSGISPIGNVNNSYGSLLYAYLNALDIDMVIYSINPQISVEKIRRDISYLKSRGVKEVALYVSENVYLRRLIADGRICTFNISESPDIENYIEIIQKEFKTFSKSDVENNKLTDYIYEVFTNAEEKACEID